jgi:hypothetical protein
MPLMVLMDSFGLKDLAEGETRALVQLCANHHHSYLGVTVRCIPSGEIQRGVLEIHPTEFDEFPS